MSKETLTKIWSVVVLSGTYFSINVFVVTQGGHFLLPGLKLEQIGPRAAAVYGTWFAMPILMLSLLLVIVYIKRFGGIQRSARLPIAFNLKLDFNDWMARAYQGFIFLAFLLIPTYASCHFLRKLLNGTITDKDNNNVTISETPFEHLTQYVDLLHVLGSDNRYRFENDITFYPFWQPWLSVLMTLICFGMFLYVVYLMVKPMGSR